MAPTREKRRRRSDRCAGALLGQPKVPGDTAKVGCAKAHQFSAERPIGLATSSDLAIAEQSDHQSATDGSGIEPTMAERHVHGDGGAYVGGEWVDIEDCDKHFNMKSSGLRGAPAPSARPARAPALGTRPRTRTAATTS